MISIARAINSLCPKAEFVIRGDVYEGIEWHSIDIPIPSKEELEIELARLQAEYDSKEYQRKRSSEYPSLADFADAYYWAQKGNNTKMDEYIAKCGAIKEKYPKVNNAN